MMSGLGAGNDAGDEKADDIGKSQEPCRTPKILEAQIQENVLQLHEHAHHHHQDEAQGIMKLCQQYPIGNIIAAEVLTGLQNLLPLFLFKGCQLGHQPDLIPVQHSAPF